jgi:hypothetical protein
VLTLEVHSAHRGSQSIPTPCNPPYCVNGQITSTGTVAAGSGQFSLTQDDGSHLQGPLSGTQLHASGTDNGNTLTLDGTPAGNGAAGNFSLHAPGSIVVAGTFTLAPQLGTQQRKELQPYDPTHGGGSQQTCGSWCQLKQALHDWFGL